jgi:hypothetical protein
MNNKTGSCRSRFWIGTRTCVCATSLLHVLAASSAWSQSTPIAIVPEAGVKVTGALDIGDGRAMIATSGSVTAGDRPVTVTVPHRGNLRICQTTQVNLMADSTLPPPSDGQPRSNADAPGLMMSLDRGAMEANFATGKNSDVVLTPDFRILISGPGIAQVRVRLGAKGDTCVDNRGPNAPYVTVSSLFDGGVYRVQENQRVMFLHGSLLEVIDNEKESCGCPVEPPKSLAGNEFPLAQSEGLAPAPSQSGTGTVPQVNTQLSYNGPEPAEKTPEPATAAPAQPNNPAPPPKLPRTPKQPGTENKPGFFARIGHFFHKLFVG